MRDQNDEKRARHLIVIFLPLSFVCPLRIGAIALTLAVSQAFGNPAETWQNGYTESDATGAHVLGYWQFKPGDPIADSSGHGHTLTLNGAVAAGGGRFDGALESFPGWPREDKRHAAIAATSAALSPKGAFSIEMWIKPKPELAADLSPVLIDKKYVAPTDYQWRLTTADKGGARHLQVALGFGDESETFSSDSFIAGTDWQHIAFTYDGAGTVRFFRNGAPLGGATKPGRGPVAPGKHALSIGDRVGSNYAGFPGLIDEVRICDGALEFRPMTVEFQSERKTWLRMEKVPPVSVVIHNLGKVAAKLTQVRISVEGLDEKTFTVAELAAGATSTIAYPLDTSLRPDTYRLKAHLEAPGNFKYVSDESTEIVIAPRPLAKMPVVMWGLGSPGEVKGEMARLKDLGFTLCLGGAADYDSIWAAKGVTAPGRPDHVSAVKGMLDYALANDFGIAFSLSPGGWLKERPELQRTDRNGKPYASRPDVDAALPGLAEFCLNVGASVGKTYREFPSWQAVLIDTETRDSTQLSFSEFDRAAYRKSSGAGIPAEVESKTGFDWTKLKDFPAERVLPDDDPRLQYLRWFWTIGDGWNNLHTATRAGIRLAGRDDVWTWFDPAIRAPSVGGSGGAVDVLGQWTYTNPDPLRIGYFTDEVFAMAANSPQHPRVMKMTQLFWYRSQVAPKAAGTNHIASPFDDHDPEAAYITISPMHLRESFWTKLARPVSGIMYHGWQALVPTDNIGGYRYTNPDTKEEFRRLHRGILEKLGPTLLRVGERRSDVAYLDSFTAQMFAHRGSYGYSGDEAYLTLLHAQLQPEVIYEDQVVQQGLDAFKVLVLANCDVLTSGVVQRVLAFQKGGGIVIGDEALAPAIKPDILLATVTRTKRGAADHAAILAAATHFRAALDSRYSRPADSSNPEIVARVRASGKCDYVFVVNDQREFGSYVGQHGLVMDNGVPSSGELTLNRPTGHVYDLVRGGEVPAYSRENKLRWPVNLGPCDGRVYAITSEAIAAVKLAAPDSAARGSAVSLNVQIEDHSERAIDAVLPIHLEISDPAGRVAEYSGYYGAVGGRLSLRLDIARNDIPGVWQIRARELASGKESTVYVRITPS